MDSIAGNYSFFWLEYASLLLACCRSWNLLLYLFAVLRTVSRLISSCQLFFRDSADIYVETSYSSGIWPSTTSQRRFLCCPTSLRGRHVSVSFRIEIVNNLLEELMLKCFEKTGFSMLCPVESCLFSVNLVATGVIAIVEAS